MSQSAKKAAFSLLSRVARALAAPVRLQLLDLLGQAPRTVEALATQLGQSVANTSHHLRQLAAAGLVERRRDGTFIEYRLASDEVAELLIALRGLARDRNPEMDAALRELAGPDDGPVDPAELVRRVRRGEVVLIDVRPREEYEAGHVRGARCFPPDELAARLDELPPDAEIVAYCRGPLCVFAGDAVRVLREEGRVSHRLEGGPRELAALGLELAQGPLP